MFGKPQTPQKLFQTRVNQSVLGLPYPVVMGTAQVQQSVLWIDGFKSLVVAQGKSKGGQSLSYSANVIAALCNGPINGVGDIWSGQDWLGNPLASEQYTISGGGIYTPNSANSTNNDWGVGTQTVFSGSFNDLGAPVPTSISGNDLAKMTKVAYGATLLTGQYSINPADGTYNFNTGADAGKTVTIFYSSTKDISLDFINAQENDLVPNNGPTNFPNPGPDGHVHPSPSSAPANSILVNSGDFWVTAGVNTPVLNADLGVRDAITLVAFTRVAGTPTLAGTYAVTYPYQANGYNKGTAAYTFAAVDVGREVTITYIYLNNDASLHGQNAAQNSFLSTLNYTLNLGNPGQTPYALLTASYPSVAFGYTNLATILYQPMQLGGSGTIQQNKFEVVTPDVMGSGIQDCNPIDCIAKVLTNQQWGLGVGPVPFPVSVLDNGSLGTWGAASGTPGARSSASTAWNWFTANSFFISPVLDSQSAAASIMSKWLEAGMCAGFMSEGLLKFVPYGDTTTAANGATWVAPSAYIVALDDTTFVGKEGEDPIKITRTDVHDAWNAVQVQWNNRSNQYSAEITPESDQSLINRWGERREDPQTWDFIHTLVSATFAANMRLKHGLYIRNTYEFTLPYSYSYLECMDICTISTTSIWAAGLNNVNLGVDLLPVRIIKIVDDPTKGLTITAEDYPFGAHQPTIYNKQISTAAPAVNMFKDPGLANVVMFEATNRLTGFDGDQIWIGANGSSDAYGGCNIWVSQDNITYNQIGSIKSPAILGTVGATFYKNLSGSPLAYDPDTVDNLVVNLTVNSRALVAGTQANADNNATLCFVDGEFISYSDVTVTGQNQVTMGSHGSPLVPGYIRRGQMGSTISAHVLSGSPLVGGAFMFLDSAIFKYTYDPLWRGETLYFKFQAVNSFGNSANKLSSLVPVLFTLPGVNPGTVDAATGLVIANTGLPLGLVGPTPTNGGVSDGGSNFSATGSTLTYRPLTNPLTSIALNVGSPVTGVSTISVAAFTMRTSSKGDISINSGSIIGLDASTLYSVYYDDSTLAGGSVTFHATTTKETAINGTGRFFVGSILTPPVAGSNTIGNNDGGVGAQNGGTTLFLFGATAQSGNAVLNPSNAIDGDTSTFAELSVTNGTVQASTLTLSGAVPTSSAWISLTLNVLSSVAFINGSNATATLQVSLDGGASFSTTLYTVVTASRALTTDKLVLSRTQNLSLIRVKAALSDTGTGGGMNQNLYEAWVTAVS